MTQISTTVNRLLIRRWFLIALVLVLVIGFSQATRLESLAGAVALRNGIVASVLLLMSLRLETSAMWRALRRPSAAALAVAITFGLLPLVAWPASLCLRGDFAVGLLVVAATPCTLASASVWTRRAGGNDAVSMVVTIVTNLSCFIITPLWLVATTGDAPNMPDPKKMVAKLMLLVVLPIVLGQLLRLYKPLGIWAGRRQIPLGVAAQCGILSIVLLGSIKAGVELSTAGAGMAYGGADFAAMVVVVLGVHLVMLYTGLALARVLGIPRKDRIAVAFAGSQKTLMVGLAIAIDYGGLVLLPMVVYHVGQLLLDTVVADRMQRGTSAQQEN